jgi:hypothetical protein
MMRCSKGPWTSLTQVSLATAALLLTLTASCAKPAPTLDVSSTVQPDELARQLADSSAVHPLLLHVGFAPLYRSGHIPNSRYVGPGSKPEGLAALKTALAAMPADQPVVLYCGCCPWTDCPNVRPAFTTAVQSGHRDVKVLFVEKTLEKDWIQRGFPSEKGE